MSVPHPHRLGLVWLVVLGGVCWIMPFQARADVELKVTRLATNPVVSLDSSASLGNKINGPSVIRVPSWIEDPLGTYYMYFAHHKGKFIRLAYADSIAGPWTVYEPGTLRLPEAESFENHIASPDVHIDKYEGIEYPVAPSHKGGAVEVQQLRDPYLFEDDGGLYLFYAVAGEMGIAVAEITIVERADAHE